MCLPNILVAIAHGGCGDAARTRRIEGTEVFSHTAPGVEVVLAEGVPLKRVFHCSCANNRVCWRVRSMLAYAVCQCWFLEHSVKHFKRCCGLGPRCFGHRSPCLFFNRPGDDTFCPLRLSTERLRSVTLFGLNSPRDTRLHGAV